MADSMCGPSNALQNFQKHSTVDRTLQQDRLISRQSPSQGFRSTPGPNSGLLDREFEAFQAGQLPLDHGLTPQGFAHAAPSMQQVGPPGWASDFQSMHISGSSSQLQRPAFNAGLQNRQDTAGWHQDFAMQQNNIAGDSIGQVSGQSNAHFSAAQYQNNHMAAYTTRPQFTGVVGPQAAEISMAQQSQSVEAFDEQAFAKAFEEAAKLEIETEEKAQEDLSQQGVELDHNTLVAKSAEELLAATEGPLNQERIGADTIHNPLSDESSNEVDHNDPDALARTAARLLDSVRHDQSSKFQNSQFLELMRQFRDREATVEGDQVVGAPQEHASKPVEEV